MSCSVDAFGHELEEVFDITVVYIYPATCRRRRRWVWLIVDLTGFVFSHRGQRSGGDTRRGCRMMLHIVQEGRGWAKWGARWNEEWRQWGVERGRPLDWGSLRQSMSMTVGSGAGFGKNGQWRRGGKNWDSRKLNGSPMLIFTSPGKISGEATERKPEPHAPGWAGPRGSVQNASNETEWRRRICVQRRLDFFKKNKKKYFIKILGFLSADSINICYSVKTKLPHSPSFYALKRGW